MDDPNGVTLFGDIAKWWAAQSALSICVYVAAFMVAGLIGATCVAVLIVEVCRILWRTWKRILRVAPRVYQGARLFLWYVTMWWYYVPRNCFYAVVRAVVSESVSTPPAGDCGLLKVQAPGEAEVIQGPVKKLEMINARSKSFQSTPPPALLSILDSEHNPVGFAFVIRHEDKNYLATACHVASAAAEVDGEIRIRVKDRVYALGKREDGLHPVKFHSPTGDYIVYSLPSNFSSIFGIKPMIPGVFNPNIPISVWTPPEGSKKHSVATSMAFVDAGLQMRYSASTTYGSSGGPVLQGDRVVGVHTSGSFDPATNKVSNYGTAFGFTHLKQVTEESDVRGRTGFHYDSNAERVAQQYQDAEDQGVVFEEWEAADPEVAGNRFVGRQFMTRRDGSYKALPAPVAGKRRHGPLRPAHLEQDFRRARPKTSTSPATRPSLSAQPFSGEDFVTRLLKEMRHTGLIGTAESTRSDPTLASGKPPSSPQQPQAALPSESGACQTGAPPQSGGPSGSKQESAQPGDQPKKQRKKKKKTSGTSSTGNTQTGTPPSASGKDLQRTTQTDILKLQSMVAELAKTCALLSEKRS